MKQAASLLFCLLFGVTATAQVLTNSGQGSGDTDTGYTFRGGPTSITQNTDTATITALNSVACPADNDAYYRRFDLDGAHAIPGNYNVTDVDFGVETTVGSGAAQNIIVNLYSIANADPLMLANLTMVGTATISVAEAAGFIQNAVVAGTVNGATDDLVVEIVANDTTNGTTFFIGSNAAGQSAPSFILSAGCGATEPTDIAALGFPNMHIVMVVNGTQSAPDADLGLTLTNNAVPPVTIGTQFDYTLTASNNGPGNATGVMVVQSLPSQAMYIADTCGAGVVGSTLTWNVGNLAASANAACDVTVQVTGFGDLTSTATISGNETDPVAGNDAAANVLGGAARGVPALGGFGIVALLIGVLVVARRFT